MVFAKTIGRKIDFARNCMAESTAYFFVIILDFILTSFIKIKKLGFFSKLTQMIIHDHRAVLYKKSNVFRQVKEKISYQDYSRSLNDKK